MDLQFLFDEDDKVKGAIDVHRLAAIIHEAQNQLAEGSGYQLLSGLYNQIHEICLHYQLRTLASQAADLGGSRWLNTILSISPKSVCMEFWTKPNRKDAEKYSLNINTPSSKSVFVGTDNILNFICLLGKEDCETLIVSVIGPSCNQISSLGDLLSIDYS